MTDMRQRLLVIGLDAKLSRLLEKLARALETPEQRKARQEAASVVATVIVGSDDNSSESRDDNEATPATAGELQRSNGPAGPMEMLVESTQGLGPTRDGRDTELRGGPELGEVIVGCVGALSTILYSPEAKNVLLEPGNHVLEALAQLATTPLGR